MSASVLLRRTQECSSETLERLKAIQEMQAAVQLLTSSKPKSSTAADSVHASVSSAVRDLVQAAQLDTVKSARKEGCIERYLQSRPVLKASSIDMKTVDHETFNVDSSGESNSPSSSSMTRILHELQREDTTEYSSIHRQVEQTAAMLSVITMHAATQQVVVEGIASLAEISIDKVSEADNNIEKAITASKSYRIFLFWYLVISSVVLLLAHWFI